MAFEIRPRSNGEFQAIVEAPGFPPVCGTFPDEGSARSWVPAISQSRERRFESGEEERLLGVIDNDKTLLVRALTVLLESGMRRGEVTTGARWENLYIEDDYAVLWLPEFKQPDPTCANGRLVALSSVAAEPRETSSQGLRRHVVQRTELLVLLRQN